MGRAGTARSRFTSYLGEFYLGRRAPSCRWRWRCGGPPPRSPSKSSARIVGKYLSTTFLIWQVRLACTAACTIPASLPASLPAHPTSTRYRYLLHVDGNVASSRLASEMHVGSTVFKQDSFSGEYAARDRGLLMISARLTDDGRHFVSLEIAGGLLISARLT